MRKFFAILLILLLWLTVGISFLLWGINSVLLQPETYKQALIQEQFYTQALNVSTEQSPVDQVIISQLLSSAFSPQWLQENTEKIIDNTWLVFRGKIQSQQADLTINLTESKNKIKQSLTDQFQQQVAPDYQGQVTEFMDLSYIDEEIPDNINLAEYIFTPSVENQLPLIAFWLSIYNFIVISGFLISAFLLVIIIILLSNKLKTLFRWTGISLFTPGIFSLPALLIFKLTVKNNITELILNNIQQSAEFSLELQNLLINLFTNILNKFTNFFLWPAIIFSIVGLILIIISFFIKSKNK